jgi:hypothetical protein
VFRFPQISPPYGAIMHENEIAATAAIRTRLQIERQVRELAPFTLAIDSKLRGAIWSLSGSMMLPRTAMQSNGRPCVRERLDARCASS